MQHMKTKLKTGVVRRGTQKSVLREFDDSTQLRRVARRGAMSNKAFGPLPVLPNSIVILLFLLLLAVVDRLRAKNA
tara:strand:- start:59 stop:286 length:228 start_codon:yes stop_codon:yes gene_type:complete